MKASGDDWGVLLVGIVLAILLPWWVFVLLIALCGFRPNAGCGIIP